MLVSAFLLFLIQPMFAKVMLPSLGGTPAVWTTCMVFFQTALIAGYGYAHLGARWLTAKQQCLVHVALVAVSLVALPIGPVATEPPAGAQPTPWLVWVLALSLGLPFTILSATAPMLQHWLAAGRGATARDPYFLYGASNLGSLVALIAYPAAIEPLLTLRQQSNGWSVLYASLLAFFALSAWFLVQSAGRDRTDAPPEATPEAPTRIGFLRRARWTLLAFAPSSLMLGVTTHVTTDIAAVPLLWVVPLALYLLSFVIAFARRPVLRHGWMVRAQPVILLGVIVALLWGSFSTVWLVALLHALMFLSCAMVCHGELAKDRPATWHLTEFYLWIAIGGALGGAFNALIAPQLFTAVLEYPIALTLACLLRPASEDRRPLARVADLVQPLAIAGILWLWKVAQAGTSYQALTIGVGILLAMLLILSQRRPVRFGLSVGVIAFFGYAAGIGSTEHGKLLAVHRSFFGIHKVYELLQYRVLHHGTTAHGAQAATGPQSTEPLMYFHRGGPLGRIFVALNQPLRGKRIGIAGLGAGAIACYAKAGQRFTFFEIDPAVVSIATDPQLFTYLSKCGETRPDIVTGDARITLAREPDGAFGLLILDAFSSDAIPVHLVTREAVSLYLRKLAPDGVMAFNVSNRFIDLAPVLAAIAHDLGLAGRMADESRDLSGLGSLRLGSAWVVLARKPSDLGTLWEGATWSALPAAAGIKAWTDDYSNILSALRAIR
jgi:hypothetical protein